MYIYICIWMIITLYLCMDYAQQKYPTGVSLREPTVVLSHFQTGSHLNRPGEHVARWTSKASLLSVCFHWMPRLGPTTITVLQVQCIDSSTLLNSEMIIFEQPSGLRETEKPLNMSIFRAIYSLICFGGIPLISQPKSNNNITMKPSEQITRDITNSDNMPLQKK